MQYTIAIAIGIYVISASLFACDFEEDTCTIRQTENDDFDWRWYSGSTPTYDTGPEYAASGDFYLYIETSPPREAGQKAVYGIISH